jgi:hypothetical protein
MSAISTDVALLIALFTVLLLSRRRKPNPPIAAFGSQTMCPTCGLITSRLEARCLECGESVTAVSVTQIVGR